MVSIQSITIKGFKSIQALDAFEPSQINLLIGANGAGKSNFIGFFRMLSWCAVSLDQFQNFIADAGYASALLFDGPETTREVDWSLVLKTDAGLNEYSARLVHGAGDILFFADEKVRFSKEGIHTINPAWISFGAGHKESKLFENRTSNSTADSIYKLLQKVVVYQFHNTAPKAPIRNRWNVNDGQWLKENANNLGSFLFRLFREHPAEYRRIVQQIRLILPFFDDFVLEPERDSILLRWKEKGSSKIFDATLASDGMLRCIALVTLLAQPTQSLPAVMFIDEPELGLHPSAIESLAGLIKTASRHCQMFISTQSPTLVDMFEPEDIVVVERINRASTFKHLSSFELEKWLESYSMSELWEKNIFGGQP
ncbi:MAG: AAA family ATPase [Saprospiraceae bacterium]|nr:AAA family ATPase [Saprospiraceae bacterium]